MPICGPNQQLTRDQVAQLMRNANFPEAVIPIGIAVATAESGLASGNCNLNDPYGGSFGLWQINGAHFSSGGTSQACAFDPQCSTNYAFKLWSNAGGWRDWGAYTSGAYQQYLGGNVPPPSTSTPLTQTIAQNKCPDAGQKCTCDPGYQVAANALGKPICKNQSFPFDARPCQECGAVDPLTQISNFLGNLSLLGEWFSDPVRIIKLVIGVVLIGAAIFLIASPEGQFAQAISKGARKVGAG